MKRRPEESQEDISRTTAGSLESEVDELVTEIVRLTKERLKLQADILHLRRRCSELERKLTGARGKGK